MKLYPFQQKGVDWLVDHFRCLLSLDMGSGKTIIALSLVARCRGIKSVLVVCPASLKLNWAREAGIWAPRHSVQIVDGRQPVALVSDIVVINYDILSSHAVNFSLHDFDLVVFDECHMLKNIEAARTKAAMKYLTRSARVIFMSGSPMLNRPSELWAPLRAISKSISGTQEEFETRYCGGRYDKFKKWWAMGATNLEELHEKLKPVMLRRTKAEVLPELPEKVRTVIELADLPASLVDLQNRIDPGWRQALRCPVATRPAAATKRLGTELSTIRRLDGIAKVGQVVAHVRMLLDAGEKVLLFGWHREVIQMLADKLKCDRIIVGDTPGKVRQRHVDDFQKYDEVRLLIGNIQSMGVGLTMTEATCVVFAELSFVPLDMLQAEDRAHRIGLKHSVSVQYLVAAGSVDSRLGPALIRKLSHFEQVVDGAGLDLGEIFL
jgi:SWI/SNF-related matrix-associated actin-dependent regulator 1 of chromatin subfamily A